MADTTLTWLGHAAFRLDTRRRQARLRRPVPDRQPEVPRERADARARRRHRASRTATATTSATRSSSRKSTAPRSSRSSSSPAGSASRASTESKLTAPNKGGTVDGRRRQDHAHERVPLRLGSDGSYAGEPCGHRRRDRGRQEVYFAGDTCVFGDMQLIGRIYEPDVAVLPIGDHFTMGPEEAAVAVELLGVKRSCRATTARSPLLTGTPEELEQLAPGGVTIEKLAAGRLGDRVRERWFGATGRRVPELAVEGELDVEDALVLDDASTPSGCARRSTRERPSSCARHRPRRSRPRSPARRSPAYSSPRAAPTCSRST